ncbi:hypothetical protein L211DRAFT_835833 [Terfezia boudieri ATCC MYA-4762]|uniref:Uncharacterized protein n=1 Tax=Terfezia boudieri ATCC MYA-4762 TaxID=1051890 RepID=A0A3N4LS97_9PEZI|nr:hypothetical protein L211DRAFT_835833 [Terfezia boudieri ATCC MYA-4762]
MSLEKVLRSRFPRYLGEGDTCTLTIDNVWVLPLKLTLEFGANEDTTDNTEAIVAALQECLLSISIHADIKLVSGSRSSKDLCYLIIFNETDAAVCAEQIHKLGFANGEILQAVEVVSQEEWGRKIAELYEKNALGRDALDEAEELIKKLKGLIGDADGASVPELKLRLYVAEKDLEGITITNLYKTHMQALQEYLETPLPPAAHTNINAALHLLRAYDPIITDPNRDFSICFYQGRQVAALRGEQQTLGSYRDELAEFLGVDSTEAQVWQEPPLTFVINELVDMDLIAGAAGHWNV